MGCRYNLDLLKEKKMVRTNLSLFDNFNQLTRVGSIEYCSNYRTM